MSASFMTARARRCFTCGMTDSFSGSGTRRALKAQQAVDFHNECAGPQVRIPVCEGVAFVGVHHEKFAPWAVLPPEAEIAAEEIPDPRPASQK